MYSPSVSSNRLDNRAAARLKREAARRGCTMSELVEMALRMLFRAPKRTAELPELPSFDSGGALVDLADRSALYGPWRVGSLRVRR
jgi:hypothetical protein